MYHVQTTEAKALPNLENFPHHENVEKLWLTKWKIPCTRGIYPFMDGNVEDFEPIFQELVKQSKGTADILYDPDAYAAPFIPVADGLVEEAKGIEHEDTTKAKELYLRAAAVYRISRFPIIRTELLGEIWRKQKHAYAQAGQYMSPKLQEIEIPFIHADESRGDKTASIQAYLRVPEKAMSPAGHPPLLFICGLDAYRPDLTTRHERHLKDGLAIIVFEIPGTGDCPASRADPESPDRIMSSVLDWVYANGARLHFDLSKICARGISTGGYYALRVAHTHKDQLFSVVAQGGGSHHMFDESWIKLQDQMEYPFALAEALAYKFGYDSVEEYAKTAQERYSLADIGVRDSCRLLIVNGMEDSIFPVEDSILMTNTGGNKDLSLWANLRHMAFPYGEEFLYDWLVNRVTGKMH